MADVQFDFNPVDWTGFSVDTVVLDEGYALWFKNHPDGDGFCQVIGDGSSVVSALTPLFTSGPKYLAAGHKFAEEKTSASNLTATSTWWVIAVTPALQRAYYARFQCLLDQRRQLGAEIACCGSSEIKTHANTTVKIKAPGFGSPAASSILACRLGKSDTVADAGFTVSVYCSIALAQQLTTLLSENSGTGSTAGFTLVEPYEDDGLLPDGSAASYLEAGAEYKTVTHANRSVVPTIGCNRITDDVLAIYGSVKDILKQNASTISLDTSSADLARFYSSDGTDNVDLLTESYTISNLSVENNEFYCQLNLIGGFTGWGAAAASFQVGGSVTFNFS